MNNIDILAKKVWDYMHLNHQLEKADAILVFGSRDLTPAERACDLYFQGYAPVIIFSGKHGADKVLPKAEAEMYAEVAAKRGVPKEAVFVENESTNTGENTAFSKRLMEKEGIPYHKIILVQKPYMERRTYATVKKQWPEPEIQVTSSQMSFEEYATNNPYDDKDGIINRMVGDLVRIREYPKLGFQIEQEMPNDVWVAGQELVRLGYSKRLPK